MNGRENQNNHELFGETPDERHTETLLRHATLWKTENPEPQGLAYRALDKKGVLSRAPRTLPIRHWWSLGTVGAGAALSILIYAHPFSLPSPLTQGNEELMTPSSRISARTNRVQENGATKSTIPPATIRKSGNDIAGSAPQKESATRPAPSLANQTAAVKEANSPKRSVTANHRSVGRCIPDTIYRPRQQTYLASERHHAPSPNPSKSELASNGIKTEPVNAIPDTSTNDTSTNDTSTNDTSTKLAESNPMDAKSEGLNAESHALVPVVLTHESEDGTEIIATPALVEVAYNR